MPLLSLLVSKRPSIPTYLTLSDDQAIESILADIPFFSVGLMAFGVFTFLLAVKRINLVSVFLYTSALVGFVAAILDLSQILTRGSLNIDQGLGLSSVSGIITAREIGFSVSFGLRFLFFWIFVAQQLTCEQSPELPTNRKRGIFMLIENETYHTARWERWGWAGIMLKWLTLTLVMAVLILQVMWRVVPSFEILGPVYEAETTIEIALSGIFIMKLSLNMILLPSRLRSRALKYYLAPILSLLISVGLGVGNVLFFAFSETTLGRFLQAVELYILILYMLICSFKHGRTSQSLSRSNKPSPLDMPPFMGIPEKARESTFNVSAPIVETPLQVTAATLGPSQSARERSAGLSTASRLSSWFIPRRMSRHPTNEAQQQLWYQDQAERGTAPIQDGDSSRKSTSLETITPRTEESKSKPFYPAVLKGIPAKAGPSPSQIVTDVAPVTEEARQGIPETALPMVTPVVPSATRPFTRFSFSSYYGLTRSHSETVAGLSQETESPIYGLDGILSRTQSSPRSGRPSNSTTSFDDLLRAQKELDNSIAALRLLSPRLSADSTIKKPPTGSSRSEKTTSLYSRRESVSGRSEFSLSIFPEPPEVETARTTLPSSSAVLLALRAQRRSRASQKEDSISLLPPPIKIPSINPGSGPNHNRFGHFDSAGTQYDVTSFIGDLTDPNASASGSGLTGLGSGAFTGLSGLRSGAGRRLSVIASENNSPNVNPEFPEVPRPHYAGVMMPPAEPTHVLPPASASSGVLTGPSGRLTGRKDGAYAFSPDSSFKSVHNVTIPGIANRKQGLPSRPRLISGPRPPPPDGRGELEPEAFERPRPPPVVKLGPF